MGNMWFWWIMFFAGLLIPAAMVIFGRVMWKHPSKEIGWGSMWHIHVAEKSGNMGLCAARLRQTLVEGRLDAAGHFGRRPAAVQGL